MTLYHPVMSLHAIVLYFKHFVPSWIFHEKVDPENIYLFKANNRNTRKSCEICSMIRSDVFIKSGHISQLFLGFVVVVVVVAIVVVDFEKINVC